MSAPALRHFRSGAVLLQLNAGFIVWAAHFLAIYCFEAIACELRFADMSPILGLRIVPLAVLLATLAALAANALILHANLPVGRGEEGQDFIRWFAAAVAITSGIAVVIDAVPAFLIQSCR